MLEAARCLTYCNFRIISLGFNRNNESKRIWILFNKFLIRTYNQHKATQWRPRFRVVDAYVRIRKAFTVEYWRKILNSFRLFGIAYIRVIRKKTRFRGSSCNPTSALNGAREVCWFAYIPGQHYIADFSRRPEYGSGYNTCKYSSAAEMMHRSDSTPELGCNADYNFKPGRLDSTWRGVQALKQQLSSGRIEMLRRLHSTLSDAQFCTAHVGLAPIRSNYSYSSYFIPPQLRIPAK